MRLSEISVGPNFDDKVVQDRMDNWYQGLADKSEYFDELDKSYELRIDYDMNFRYVYIIEKLSKKLTGKITLEKEPHELYRVSHVWIMPILRNKGYGYLLYTKLMSHGYMLLADNSQTKAAKALWTKLAANGYVYLWDDGEVGKQMLDIRRMYRRNNSHLRMIAKQ